MEGTNYKDYVSKRNYQIPFNAFSGSAISNSAPTGSHFKRYVFKSQQNYFRPEESEKDISQISDYTATSTKFEILSGSNIRKASTSGSIGDGFAYGIRDSSGQQTQQIFPSVQLIVIILPIHLILLQVHFYHKVIYFLSL